jgi:hypothetical protein
LSLFRLAVAVSKLVLNAILRLILNIRSRRVRQSVCMAFPRRGGHLCREGVEPSGPLREVSVRVDDHPPLLSS